MENDQQTKKRQIASQTLEPAPLQQRLPQLNILGSAPQREAPTASEKIMKKVPKIIEISDNGDFDLPENPTVEGGDGDDDDEGDAPPDLFDGLSDEPPSLEGAAAEDPGKSVMDEMMEAANAARKVVKDKAAAEEQRVKAEFGKGMNKGFFAAAAARGDKKKKKAGGGTGGGTGGGVVQVGARVSLHGLKARPELNGARGQVVTPLDPKGSGRCGVRLDDGRGPFHLKAAANLTVLAAASHAAAAAAAGAKGKQPACAVETLRPDKAKAAAAAASSLVLDEVQEAMKAEATPMAKALKGGEWMTQDLLQKFVTNPKLARGLTDPKFQAAIQELQKDPKAARLKFQHDKELTAFLTEFCQTMGEHFSHIGENEAREKKQSEKERQKGSGGGGGGGIPAAKAAKVAPAVVDMDADGSFDLDAAPPPPQTPAATPPPHRPLSEAAMRRAEAAAKKGAPTPAPSKKEKAQMDQILQNDELRELLMDPDMQQVMLKCQEPGRLQFFMSDPKWGPKIRKLADFGLVQIQR